MGEPLAEMEESSNYILKMFDTELLRMLALALNVLLVMVIITGVLI